MRVGRIGGVIAIGLALVLTRGCALIGRPVDTRISDITTITGVTDIAFPQGSRVLSGVYRRHWNGYLIARVAIPSATRDEFLRQELLSPAHSVENHLVQVRTHLFGMKSLPGGKYIRGLQGVGSAGNLAFELLLRSERVGDVVYVDYTW